MAGRLTVIWALYNENPATERKDETCPFSSPQKGKVRKAEQVEPDTTPSLAGVCGADHLLWVEYIGNGS